MSPSPGQVSSETGRISQRAQSLLRGKKTWSSAQRQSTAETAVRLLRKIPPNGYCLIGLAGAPGCGKSTLAHLVVRLLSERTDAIVLSLDDYYLGRSQRKRVARNHPLFTQRGVPGTHDWKTLINDLDRLKQGDTENLMLPRFDKIMDDQLSDPGSLARSSAPRVVILEGWLVGALPQETAALQEPVNNLEASRDPNGVWRRLVNEKLEQYHRDLRERLDSRWFMAVPGWNHVIDWRWQQEQEAVRSTECGFLGNRKAVSEFLDRFERIALHMKHTMNDWADVIIDIDRHHHLKIIRD